MRNFTPREIVEELEKYIIGQDKAKRAVAVALRNRWRRRQVPVELRDEIAPKNIIMIGPTGVGKTEIARRLSRLAQSPFLKVEASKFTEVGYVGRDVESMIRDLTEIAVKMVQDEEKAKVREKAERLVENKIIEKLKMKPEIFQRYGSGSEAEIADLLRQGKLDEELIEVEVSARQGMPFAQIISASGVEEMGLNLPDMLGRIFFPRKPKN